MLKQLGIVLCCVAWGWVASANAKSLTQGVEATKGDIQIEIVEGLPDKRVWDFSKATVTESYSEKAFAFPAIPTKFTASGQPDDRSSPFVIRGTSSLSLPKGEYRLLLRSRGGARLFMDDKIVVELEFLKGASSGHEPVKDISVAKEAGIRRLPPGHREKVVNLSLDGKAHNFKLEVVVGGLKLRPELGEPSISIARANEPFKLLAANPTVELSEEGWDAFAASSRSMIATRDAETRRLVRADEDQYWNARHAKARDLAAAGSAPKVPDVSAKIPVHNEVDRFIGYRLEEAGVAPAPLTDDWSFIRRVHLDTVGVIPTTAEVAAFMNDSRPDRRSRVIDRLLSDDRWADHWVSYWQDVLAENPGLLKPTLNNTGPFREWIYRSVRENLAMDRFATELMLMDGSMVAGAPSGFGIATENDVPMAAKAQTVTKAFLAVDLTCARCHDAPYQPYKQEQLFALGAMLGREGIKVPKTSSVPQIPGGRKPAVEVTLQPGTTVNAAWKFAELATANLTSDMIRQSDDPRELAAAIITAPTSDRFAKVIANRVWQRFLGVGIIDSVDDWHDAEASHPELLDYLARELVLNNYDMKQVARIILNSHTYQRTQPAMKSGVDRSLFAGPVRRRMSAEQLLDSLFVAAGKEFGCEELNFDPEGRQQIKQCLNLGTPRRAWQFVSLANERDRPALALPFAQGFVDLLVAYGWRDSRPSSQTIREETATPLQPMTLANGVVGMKVVRLSDDGAIAAVCVQDIPLAEMIDRVIRQVLTRPATPREVAIFSDLLADGYESRRTGKPANPKTKVYRPSVSWSNHLSEEATTIKMDLEKSVRAGDTPSAQLAGDWRLRMEDMLWSLYNSPEFVFVP